MAQIVETPIEYLCAGCGKVVLALSPDGLGTPLRIEASCKKDGKHYCRACWKKMGK